MTPELKEKIDKEIADFQDKIIKNGGQPISKYEMAILRSFVRWKIESTESAQ
jgi:hypothetical protein